MALCGTFQGTAGIMPCVSFSRRFPRIGLELLFSRRGPCMHPKSPKIVFSEALERENSADLTEYLDEACAEDAGLRERVDQLLSAHRKAGGFLKNAVRAPESGA